MPIGQYASAQLFFAFGRRANISRKDGIGWANSQAGRSDGTDRSARTSAFCCGRFSRRAGRLMLPQIGSLMRVCRSLVNRGRTRRPRVSERSAVHARDRATSPWLARLFESAWRFGGDLATHWTIARSLSNLASIVRLQGDYARARSFYAECLSISGI